MLRSVGVSQVDRNHHLNAGAEPLLLLTVLTYRTLYQCQKTSVNWNCTEPY